MDTFYDYEDIIGKAKLPHLKNTLHDFFELSSNIRRQLGSKGYLLDKYIYDLLKSIDAVISFDTEFNDFYDSGELSRVINGILENKGDVKKHSLYEKAKAYIDEHPLPYQERHIKLEFYIVALTGDFLEYIIPKFFDERKMANWEHLDIVDSHNLYRDISTILGGEEEMEQLNLLIRQRFMFVPAMTAFLQSLTNDLLYTLEYRDIETGKTVLRLWESK